MSRLRPAFVLTFSAASSLTASCSDPVQFATNPPELSEQWPLVFKGGDVVNPSDGVGLRIVRSATGCFVEAPHAESASPSPIRDVPCPKAMLSDPAWSACVGGPIRLKNVGPPPACECVVRGDPATPARDVACPADVQGRIRPIP